MSQFKNDLYFKFANKNSKDFGICIINKDEENCLFGINKSIIEEDGGINKNPTFYGVSNAGQEITLSLIKLDEYGDAAPMTDKEIQNINKWLFGKDYYQPLEFSNGLILYGMFIGGSNWESGGYYEGVITLTFKMGTYCAYSKIYKYPVSVTNKKTFKVSNLSNAKEFVYADILFELKDNTSNIKITNITTSETVEFIGLTKGESVHIYSDIQQMKSLIDDTRNVYLNSNRKACIKLAYGENKFEITANGRAFVNIIYQNEVALY